MQFQQQWILFWENFLCVFDFAVSHLKYEPPFHRTLFSKSSRRRQGLLSEKASFVRPTVWYIYRTTGYTPLLPFVVRTRSTPRSWQLAFVCYFLAAYPTRKYTDSHFCCAARNTSILCLLHQSSSFGDGINACFHPSFSWLLT